MGVKSTFNQHSPIMDKEIQNMMTLNELLEFTVNKNCSDLHLSSGEPPMVRRSGSIIRVNEEPSYLAEDVSKMIDSILTEDQKKQLLQTTEIDFSYSTPSGYRFRVNAFNQFRGISAAFRALAVKTPTLDDIGLEDAVFKNICLNNHGLVLVTGPTSSGKSTTLAAMINHINSSSNMHKHILTIEDPVEYLFQSKNCLIQQRQVGRHTNSFPQALRAALREDPDIIMLGEIRDLESIRLALTAAQTGHLVFATLHTHSAPNAVDRIIDVFPGSEKEMIREMLAESLQAVIAQRLMTTPDNRLRLAHEVMVCNKAVSNLIREHKVQQIYNIIETGSNVGMHTMEQHINKLLANNEIIKPEDFKIDQGGF